MIKYAHCQVNPFLMNFPIKCLKVLREEMSFFFPYDKVCAIRGPNCTYFIIGVSHGRNRCFKKVPADKSINPLSKLLNCLNLLSSQPEAPKKWRAYTSFNHNGRYYTLPGIPQFDQNGIWKYQTILFSKYGNLKQTIIQLIIQSDKGLSAKEIAQVVKITSNSSVVSQLQNVPGIRREKHQGCFITDFRGAI